MNEDSTAQKEYEKTKNCLEKPKRLSFNFGRFSPSQGIQNLQKYGFLLLLLLFTITGLRIYDFDVRFREHFKTYKEELLKEWFANCL